MELHQDRYHYILLTELFLQNHAAICGANRQLNTPFKDLYYYHLKSRSGIDLAISKALKDKRDFNESRFVKW